MKTMNNVKQMNILLLLGLIAYMWHREQQQDLRNDAYYRQYLQHLDSMANRPRQPLMITPVDNAFSMGQISCMQNGKTLFCMDSSGGTVTLNNHPYKLAKGATTAKSGLYVFSGRGVFIGTTELASGRNVNSDYFISTFRYLEIALGKDTAVLKDIEIREWPRMVSRSK